MGQIKLEDVISNLELNIRWICDNPAHQFPGYGNVEMAMRDALELLKEQHEQIETAKENFATIASKYAVQNEAHWIKKSCDALYCSNCDAPSINKQPYCYRCGSRMT